MSPGAETHPAAARLCAAANLVDCRLDVPLSNVQVAEECCEQSVRARNSAQGASSHVVCSLSSAQGLGHQCVRFVGERPSALVPKCVSLASARRRCSTPTYLLQKRARVQRAARNPGQEGGRGARALVLFLVAGSSGILDKGLRERAAPWMSQNRVYKPLEMQNAKKKAALTTARRTSKFLPRTWALVPVTRGCRSM